MSQNNEKLWVMRLLIELQPTYRNDVMERGKDFFSYNQVLFLRSYSWLWSDGDTPQGASHVAGESSVVLTSKARNGGKLYTKDLSKITK